MNDMMRTVLAEWQHRALPKSIEREVNLLNYTKTGPRKITVISGLRRVGKTNLLFGFIKKLLKEKTREELIYINFDDERIAHRTESLTAILPTCKQLFEKRVKYLFLDEIQRMPEWRDWVYKTFNKENIRLFVAGSSSHMLNKDVPAELRDIFYEIKLLPLPFREFLRFRKIVIKLDAIKESEDEKAKLFKALDEYLKYGALPEVVLADKNRKAEMINAYYQMVVRRDIIERHNIRNEEALSALLRLLLNSTSYSISKLYSKLKSLGYEIGKNTVQHYLNYIEDAYFTFNIPIFSYKIKDQMQYAKKIYVIDNGFINRISTKFSQDCDRLYENAAAINLLRSADKEEIYYWKLKKEEVDFVLRQDGKIKQIIQVCYDISDIETKHRETRALIKASKELKCDNLLFITSDYEVSEDISWFGTKRTIKFMPLWKWLLES